MVVSTVDSGAIEQLVSSLPDEVRAGALWALEVPSYPALPASVADLMILAVGAEPAFREVDRVVRHDPVLSARVLARANSALYQPSSPITSLRSAFLRLGWNNLRSVLLQTVAEVHVFRQGPRREVEAARNHCVAVAQVHRLLAQRLGLDGEHAFAAGLIHDIGTGVLLHLYAGPDAPNLEPAIRHQAMDAIHGLVGSRLCEGWGLPAVLVDACLFHHQTPSPGLASQVNATTLGMAEVLVDKMGYGCNPQREHAEAWLAAIPMASAELEEFTATATSLCESAL